MTAAFNFTNGGKKFAGNHASLADFKINSRVSDELT